MIFNVKYWKRDFKRLAIELRRRQEQLRWPDESYASLEKSIMIGFYAIRKLLDAFQPMMPVNKNTLFDLTSFPSLNKPFWKLSWPELNEHFDVTKPTVLKKDLKFICDQMVHTHLFTPWFDTNTRLAGVFFSSDQQSGLVKDKKSKTDGQLFRMDIEAIITLYEQIGTMKGKWLMRFAPEKNRFVM